MQAKTTSIVSKQFAIKVRFLRRFSKYRICYLCLVIGLTTLYLIYLYQNTYPEVGSKNFFYDEIFCYGNPDAAESLEDISDVSLPAGKNIFFHETSCKSHQEGKITINARQACAVESAAKLNPNYMVYLLYLSPGLILSEGTESDKLLQALLSYRNIKIYHADLMKYVKGTAVEKLFTKGKVQRSNYKISHTSDVIRYLSLWKYGGIYLDLDIIVIKSFDSLSENFSGVQTRKVVGAGIMGFSANSSGKEYITSCLNDIADNFDGNEWAYNGPGVISRFVSRICNMKSYNYFRRRKCKNFSVYGTETFYPISWKEWKKYFNESYNDEVQSALKSAIIIHLWNNLSSKEKLLINSNVTYMKYAKENCPRVVEQLTLYF